MTAYAALLLAGGQTEVTARGLCRVKHAQHAAYCDEYASPANVMQAEYGQTILSVLQNGCEWMYFS